MQAKIISLKNIQDSKSFMYYSLKIKLQCNKTILKNFLCKGGPCPPCFPPPTEKHSHDPAAYKYNAITFTDTHTNTRSGKLQIQKHHSKLYLKKVFIYSKNHVSSRKLHLLQSFGRNFCTVQYFLDLFCFQTFTPGLKGL